MKSLAEQEIFGRKFARRLQVLKDGLLPYLKGRIHLLEESPAGGEITPEPDSPRAYTHGDDIRYIDWNLYARLDKLYLKTTTREEEVPALLLIDTSLSMWQPEPAKLIRALEVAAALSDLFLSLGHRVLIVPWSDGVRSSYGPYSGENDLGTVMNVLSSLKAEGVSDLKRSLRESQPANGGLHTYPLVISDFLFPLNYREEIAFLATSPFATAALQILSPEEATGSLRGNLIVTDPETGREETLRAGYRVSRLYRETFQEHNEKVAALFRGRGSAFCRATSSDSFESTVQALLT